MVVEKQMAFAEGTVGTQMEMAKLAMTPWWLWPSAAAMNIGHAATGPASRRVKANARRLRRK